MKDTVIANGVMITDKNGKELKVGDKVRDDYNRAFTITALNEYSDLPIETINDMIGDGWTFASHFVELVTPAPVERTYTEAELEAAYDAGYESADFDTNFGVNSRHGKYFGRSQKEGPPSFDVFLKELNTPNHE